MNREKTVLNMLRKTGWYVMFLRLIVLSAFFTADTANDKLQTILNRAPFGPLPPPTPSAEQAADQTQIEEEENTQSHLSETVRLSAITRFNGIPAAGLTDLTSGRTFFLVEGQTLGGFRLEKVTFETSSVTLTKDNVTEPIYLAFAAGQPTNLVSHVNDNTLGTPNQPIKARAANFNTPQKTPPEPPPATELHTTYSPELIAAATIQEPDGSTRISFRELHRLRVQQSREKVEREQKEKKRAEEKKAAEEKKSAGIVEQAEAAAEKLRRKKIIQAIKDGYDVELNFELTPEEAKELADSGFDIAIDATLVNEKEEPVPE